MTNVYIEKTKITMRDFLAREKARADEIKRNNGYYSAVMSKSKNDEILNELSSICLSIAYLLNRK